MRVTFSAAFRDTAYAVDLSAGQLADAQRMVASGHRIDRPSDDPQGAASVVADHAALGALDGYTRTNDSATSRLSVIDTTLSDIISQISGAGRDDEAPAADADLDRARRSGATGSRASATRCLPISTRSITAPICSAARK